ncbi:hypothetical protein [Methylomonas sp. HYX-M1]|uniref:hypothetical protein n=1 Tax=Methylomonas sp. HYX-M1 TaxID=3139307 RepID=UPI00345BC5A5
MNRNVCSGRGLREAMTAEARFHRFLNRMLIIVSMLLLIETASVQAANQKPVALAGEEQSKARYGRN